MDVLFYEKKINFYIYLKVFVVGVPRHGTCQEDGKEDTDSYECEIC